ncbi:hypothetical protein Pint_07003 [Pistacia integerrima]|uniref:Uncharacterized protein n=1 Tax=Pistacia integerrima TaxID=434235 RepID=A0ACC0XV61_9ROSI|nr:hypothetical protein Pint_07003 [Pistacia integerrima]
MVQYRSRPLCFIVSFSFYTANPENDGKRIQEFYLTMEGAIRDQPLWAGATEEEIDSALEVLVNLKTLLMVFDIFSV